MRETRKQKRISEYLAQPPKTRTCINGGAMPRRPNMGLGSPKKPSMCLADRRRSGWTSGDDSNRQRVSFVDTGGTSGGGFASLLLPHLSTKISALQRIDTYVLAYARPTYGHPRLGSRGIGCGSRCACPNDGARSNVNKRYRSQPRFILGPPSGCGSRPCSLASQHASPYYRTTRIRSPEQSGHSPHATEKPKETPPYSLQKRAHITRITP